MESPLTKTVQPPLFGEFFRHATQTADALPYQERIALDDVFPTLLDVPTGLGKTAAAVLAWVWRRRFACEQIRSTTPRRLVYCLPMRVLVEQTYGETVKWLDRLGLLAGRADWIEPGADGLPTKESRLNRELTGARRGYEAKPEAAREDGWASDNGDQGYPIAVHLLLGGEEKSEWALWPERDAILIGTQDMLLSRALNRGYAAGRARWPLEFGLLNSDCLWVFDEIQLMDTGLASSLQLDAWRRSLRLRPSRSDFPLATLGHLARPCHSLWMSATMAKHWLERAVDCSPNSSLAWDNRHELQPEDFQNDRVKGLFANRKTLGITPIATLTVPKGKDSKPDVTDYLDKLAPEILKRKAADGLTLVIVNTVDRAVGIFRRLKEKSEDTEIFLIHSRFRPMERECWADFLCRKDGKPRIVVSTQVVEAGVDLSAKVLFTELAPWASLVQRFGRCARFLFLGDDGKVLNENGTIYWMDFADNERAVLPYSVEELGASRSILLRQSLDDVGLQALKDLRPQLVSQAATLFPYEPRFVPHDKDLFDLFDTTPDLIGADVDISRYIRDGEELDVQVFWRDDPPMKNDRPSREELCPVPFLQFREFLKKLPTASCVWRRNYRKGWEEIDSRHGEQVYPGQIFVVEKSCGGYSPELGWTGDTHHTAFELPDRIEPTQASAQDEEEDADDLSQISQWLTVLEHTRHVCRKLDELLDPKGLTDSEVKVLRLAARLHDWGKCHLAFEAKIDQKMLAAARESGDLQGDYAAKAPDGKNRETGNVDRTKNAWRRDRLKANSHGDQRRPGFRHELASALAILETLYRARPAHDAFVWPDGLNRSDFNPSFSEPEVPIATGDPLIQELVALSADEFDLAIYLVAAHHGKVRMSLRSSSDDDRTDVPDPCPVASDAKHPIRQARGVRDGDDLFACQIPGEDLNADGIVAPKVKLSLDLMEMGLSPRYGASWRERTQLLLERLGPFRLAYREALLRAADCRASQDEDAADSRSRPERG